MQARSSTIIVAGILVSFLGIVTVIAYGRSVERRTQPGPAVEAFTATRDIVAGTKGEDAVTGMSKAKVARAARPDSAITDPKQIAGRIAVRPIARGEVITGTQFGTAYGTSTSAPAAGLQIPTGFNAVTFNLPMPQGVAYYVQPGDLVNVYVTFKDAKDPRGQTQTITKLLQPNVQVLSNQTAVRAAQVRGISNASAGGGEVVLTLALRPSDVERLVFAKENGSMWFGLVHAGDPPAQTGGQTATTVLGR